MSYILIMIVLNSSGSSIGTHSVKFLTNNACLQAMQKVVGLEKHFTVKAVCVQEVLWVKKCTILQSDTA